MHTGCHSVEEKRPLSHRNYSLMRLCTRSLRRCCNSSKSMSVQGITQRAERKKPPFLLPLVSGGVSRGNLQGISY